MQIAIVNPYTVKNVKSFQGREGNGFECSLYKNGKRIGKVVDTAHGGMIDFYLDGDEKEKLDAHCAIIPKEQWDGDDSIYETEADFKKHYPDGRAIDCETVLYRLVDEFENNKRMKTLCRNKIVYIKKDDPEGLWSIKAKYTPELAKKLRDREGDALLEIVNERFV